MSKNDLSALQKLRREPLFHFLGLAALLFVANALFSGDDREVIEVDAATQQYLIEQRQNLELRELSEREKQETIETFIEQEILVREARKRGFENSSRIRTLLIQNMRFLMVSEVLEPTEEELRTYFEENIELFGSQEAVTYEHVVFNDPDSVPADTLELLRGGAKPATMGDTTQMNAKIYRVTEDYIVASFGRDQAPEILAIDDDLWHGPFQSETAVHFLRVADRFAPTRPDWESAKNWIASAWMREKTQEIVEREMATMKQSYRIEIAQAEQIAE